MASQGENDEHNDNKGENYKKPKNMIKNFTKLLSLMSKNYRNLFQPIVYTRFFFGEF